MSKSVMFEGTIKIQGSIEAVEKKLAVLTEHNIHVEPLEVERVFPDPAFPGPMVKQSIAAIFQNPEFVKENLAVAKGAVFPDNDIRGGRRYCHIHAADKIFALSEAKLGHLVLEASKRLRNLGLAREIELEE